MAVEIDWEARAAAQAAEMQRSTMEVLAKCGTRRLVHWKTGGIQVMQYTDEYTPMTPMSDVIPEAVVCRNRQYAEQHLRFENNVRRIDWTDAGKKFFSV